MIPTVFFQTSPISSIDAQVSLPKILSDPLAIILFVAITLSTLLASVMAEEQKKRLENGTFGALAGAVVGTITSLITKQDIYLFIGFFGSILGAFLGWVISLALSWLASISKKARIMLEFMTGGFAAVRNRLDIDDNQLILKSMDEWSLGFINNVRQQESDIYSLSSSNELNIVLQATIRTWLILIVDFIGFLFDIANRKKYRSRITIVIFGCQRNNILGKHWISYAGCLTSHNKTKAFNENSIGYQVLKGDLESPYFASSEALKPEQEQGRNLDKYRPFITFKLNNSTILAIDWPEKLSQKDPFVIKIRELFQRNICPCILKLLEKWHGDIEEEVNLNPITGSTPQI